jgi:hypothetical protein
VTALVSEVALHVALGVVLAAVVWTVGAGILVAARACDRLGSPDAVYAYPLGLLAAVATGALFLADPVAGIVAALVATAAIAAAICRPLRLAATRGFRGVLAGLVGIVVFAASLGFLYHGPTATENGGSFGDMLWYVGKLASAKRSLVPLRDLTAAGVDLWRGGGGPPRGGAGPAPVPGGGARV